MNSSPVAERPRQSGQFTKQGDRLLELFEQFKGQWIPLPSILKLGIAQYNTRILELRRKGHVIENRTNWEGHVKHSWFRYTGKREGA